MIVANLTVPTVSGKPAVEEDNCEVLNRAVACGLSYSEYLEYAVRPVGFGTYRRCMNNLICA